MDQSFDPDAVYARSRDEQDPLRRFRDRFYMPGGAIYLDGNSLGLLSRASETSILQALESWKQLGVRGWLEATPPWFTLGEQLAASMAPLVGAEPEAVIVTGSTTVNLHQVIGTFYAPSGRRTKILATSLDFPSDVYALKSQIKAHGGNPETDLVLVESRDGRIIEEEDIIAAMDETVAVAWLPSVLYRSGQLLDMPRLVAAAHERDILIGFDCAHSVGAIPHEFDTWGVDFAVWCTYKYLNAGPGAVGALYVNRRHWGTEPALAGWWGYRKDRQFEMSHDWEGAPHAGAYQISTLPLLSSAALLGSLEIFAEAGTDAIRERSLALTNYLIRLLDEHELTSGRYGFSIGTPLDHARRGGHVALEHPDAEAIASALVERNIVVDFRKPNVIRLAPVALYNSYTEIRDAVLAIREIAGGEVVPAQ